MARGEAAQVKVHYKGKEDDFVIFVDDAKSAKNWKTDRSIPLAQVVSSFKVFVTHKYVVVFLLRLIHYPSLVIRSHDGFHPACPTWPALGIGAQNCHFLTCVFDWIHC
jgi:hypothetical protein